MYHHLSCQRTTLWGGLKSRRSNTEWIWVTQVGAFPKTHSGRSQQWRKRGTWPPGPPASQTGGRWTLFSHWLINWIFKGPGSGDDVIPYKVKTTGGLDDSDCELRPGVAKSLKHWREGRNSQLHVKFQKCKNTILAKQSHSRIGSCPAFVTSVGWNAVRSIHHEWENEGLNQWGVWHHATSEVSLRSPSAEKHTNILPLPTGTLDTINSFVIFVLIRGLGYAYCRKTLSNTHRYKEESKICLNFHHTELRSSKFQSPSGFVHTCGYRMSPAISVNKGRARHPALSYCSHLACSPWGDSAWRKTGYGPWTA